MTPSERGRIIWKIGDLILDHVTELAQLESLDNGKPFGVAAAADVPLAADLFHSMAGWVTKIEGNTINRGYFIEPTMLTNTRPDMKVVREEIFGPVVMAAPFRSLAEIAAVANDSTYGLGAGIWTKNISKAHALAKKLRAGTVWINCREMGHRGPEQLHRGQGGHPAAVAARRPLHGKRPPFRRCCERESPRRPGSLNGPDIAGQGRLQRAASRFPLSD